MSDGAETRLLHSPNLVAIGLSVGYETGPLIDCVAGCVIGWTKYGLQNSSDVDELVQEWRNSSTLATELCLSCINP